MHKHLASRQNKKASVAINCGKAKSSANPNKSLEQNALYASCELLASQQPARPPHFGRRSVLASDRAVRTVSGEIITRKLAEEFWGLLPTQIRNQKTR
jgi:hypothetical protein